MRRALWLYGMLLLSAFGCEQRPAESPKEATAGFALTRDGRPTATIVIAKEPTQAARFAADELQYHVKKITGAVLPITTDASEVAGSRLLVGESKATRALGLKGSDFGAQEYLIRFTPDALILMGRDTEVHEAAKTCPDRVAGKFARALKFNGTTDVVALPDCAFNDEAGTMEAWVWLPAEKQELTHGTILRLDGAEPWTYHILQRDSKSSRISYTTYDGKKGHGVKSRDLAEGWHHVAATHDAQTGRMELFVDGTRQGSAEYVKTTCKGAVLGIGGMHARDGGAVGNPFKGLIDEVRVSAVVRDDKGRAGGPYATDPDTACLFHFDEESGPPEDSAGGVRLANPPDLFGDNGSLYAVYDLLERFCDVRWYAPTEIGTVFPTTATLTVRGTDLRRSPAMIHRWITPTPLYMPGPPDRVPIREVQVWKLRMRIGGQNFWVCHSFYGYYARFLKEHPDWFAQGYTGKPPQMCYTNPAFIAQVVQDARDYFDGKGAKPGATAVGDVFGLVPMDNSQWCKCPRCQAEMNAAEQSNQQFNNGKASDYVWNFINKVAREVRKTHPNKWIGALAYSSYAYYPAKVRPEPNVIVQLCLHTRNWWCPSMEANDRKVLKDWREREPQRPRYLWLYYCFPALNAKHGKYHFFPGFFAHTVVPQMKLYHDAGIRGIFMEHSSECGQTYLMDQLEFYVTLKLADDPTLDGNQLIEEFFTRYYGAAAGPMKDLYCKIEDTFSNPRNYPVDIQNSPSHQHQNQALAWGSLGTEKRMAEFDKLMAQAREAPQTPLERERVAMFQKGIWDYMVEGRKMYLGKSALQPEINKLKAQAPPSGRVPCLKGAEADGDPAKVDWTKALALGGWRTLEGYSTNRKVKALLIHDHKYLYVQLEEMLDPSKLVSDGGIWMGDDWEVFFAAQRGKPYRQIGVNPMGGHLELAHGETGAWDSGVKVVSNAKVPDRWTVRIALPLDKLLPGGLKPGGKFYANFYRATPNLEELLAWSPNFSSSFHETSRMGELVLE